MNYLKALGYLQYVIAAATAVGVYAETKNEEHLALQLADILEAALRQAKLIDVVTPEQAKELKEAIGVIVAIAV